MAFYSSSSLNFFFFLSCFLGILNTFHARGSQLVLPVKKDVSTLQFLAEIHHGTPPVPTKLVVDLSGPLLWLDCASRNVSSSSRLIQGRSTQCSKAKAHDLRSQSRFSGDAACDLLPHNSITGLAGRGDLVEDVVAVGSVDGSQAGQISIVHDFLLTCAPTFILQGLASGAKGMLGLGRSQISLPSQVADAGSHHRRFTVCLSASNGGISSGDDGSVDSIFGADISRSLMYTPLIANPVGMSQDYFINVKSIKINSKRLSLNKSLLPVDETGKGGTKLSTIVPYTTMENSIYTTFIRAYTNAAASMNMTRVPSVVPFELCFAAAGVSRTKLGPAVPTIDLVLQSEMVKWRIHGRNSMVDVGNDVMCLGILDGGLNPETSIVIGGFQMEDNILEFDLGTSMLGFSSSLLMKQRSCSDFISNSKPQASY